MPENVERKNREEIKPSVIYAWKIFFWEAFLFCFTLGLGIASAPRLKEFLKEKEIILPAISFWQFLLYFFLATAFIFALSFFRRKGQKGRGILFKVIFIFVTCWGGLVSFGVWIGDFALIPIALLIFGWLKRPTIVLHNLCMIFGLAGIGAMLGIRLNPLIVIALLIIFSIYDFIAVYKTKHMVKMAKEMIARGVILALIVPQKISDFKAGLKEARPGGKFLILGGGDIAFPLLFCVSLISEGIASSLIVALFALIGLFVGFLFFIFQKVRAPIPALPPIAFFSIIGFLITRLI